MPDTPKLWQVPDSPDYGKNGRRFEHSFWVLDEVSTVLGLATETMATGCLLEAAAFFLGSGSVAIGGLFGEFWAIGSGYAEASSEIAKDWVTTGYCRGVVLAAHGRKAGVMQRMFGGRVTWNTLIRATTRLPTRLTSTDWSRDIWTALSCGLSRRRICGPIWRRGMESTGAERKSTAKMPRCSSTPGWAAPSAVTT